MNPRVSCMTLVKVRVTPRMSSGEQCNVMLSRYPVTPSESMVFAREGGKNIRSSKCSSAHPSRTRNFGGSGHQRGLRTRGRLSRDNFSCPGCMAVCVVDTITQSRRKTTDQVNEVYNM